MATKGFDTFRREIVRQVKQERTCVYQKDSEIVRYISNGVWALDLSVLRLPPVELDYLVTEATSVAVARNGEIDIARIVEPVRTNNTTKAEDVGLRIHNGKRVFIPLLPEDDGRIVFLDEAKVQVFVKAAAMKKETVSFKVRTLDEDTGERTVSPVLVCTSAEDLGVIMPVRLDKLDRRIRHTAKLLGEQLPA
jgi:hypothetical protein